MITQLSILLVFILVAMVVLYFTLCRHKDNYYNLYAVRGTRYDPEIVAKSGGMAGFSTFPVDTHPDMGYINYPWYPYYNTNYMVPYGSPRYGYTAYLPDSLYSRTYYDRPYYESYLEPYLEPYLERWIPSDYELRLMDLENFLYDEY